MTQPDVASQASYVDPSGRRFIRVASLGRWTCLMRCDGSDKVHCAFASSGVLRLLYMLAIMPGVIIAMSLTLLPLLPMLPLLALPKLTTRPTIMVALFVIVLCINTALTVWCIVKLRAWARSSVICMESIAMLIGIALWSCVAVAIWLNPTVF